MAVLWKSRELYALFLISKMATMASSYYFDFTPLSNIVEILLSHGSSLLLCDVRFHSILFSSPYEIVFLYVLCCYSFKPDQPIK